jgi:hypothetical protein
VLYKRLAKCSYVSIVFIYAEYSVTSHSLLDRRYLLLAALSDHISSPQTNTSLLCALYPHSCALEKTSRPVTHPKITLGQARLTQRSRDRLPKKKMHLIDMSTLLILLNLGLGYHHPLGPGYHNPPPLEDRRPRRSTPS